MAMVIPFTLQACRLVGVLLVGGLRRPGYHLLMILVYFIWGSMFSLFPAIIGDYFGARATPLPITAFSIRPRASLPLAAADCRVVFHEVGKLEFPCFTVRPR